MRAERFAIGWFGCWLGCWFGCGQAAPEANERAAAAHVTCKAVVVRPVDETIDVSGVIAPPPMLDAIVSSPISGRVARVAVEEGDHVEEGALLATVEDPALPAGRIEARAGVSSAQAAKLAAEQELARQTRLVEAGIGARRDLDEARAKATAAGAEVDAANARDHLASQRLSRRELRAPHAGVVLHVWKRAGESVDGTAATPIAEIADLTVLEVRGQVAAPTLTKLHEGLSATVRVSELSVPATVVRVAPALDPATLLGTVRVRLAGLTPAPPVGSAATARIVVAQRAGLVVPASALRRSPIGSDELVVCEHEVARVRTVEVGLRGDLTEITKGLAAGEQVVVDHALGLEDGQPLVGSP